MKICLLNVLHEPLDKRMYYKVSRSLVDAGHTLVSIAPRSDALPGAAHCDTLIHGDIRFVFIPAASGFVSRLISVMRLIRLGRRERADLYLAPEPESWVAALCIKLVCGGKVVLDMHEYIPGEFAKFFPAPLRPFMEWVTLRFMRLFARYTDLIILTRESFDHLWQGLGTPRVTVINTNHLQPPCKDRPDNAETILSNKQVILHQGIFGDIRGSYHLLQAMTQVHLAMPHVRCIVLGRYVYGDVQAYREAIAQAGLEEVLLLVDEVPFEEVPAWTAAAHLGLILFQPFPKSHVLAMPHKLFDYMREARPVIAPDFAVEVARIVEEARCGILVDVTSPKAIADAILYLLHNPEEAERLGRNGRRLIEDKYNWQQDEQRLIQAIAALE